MSNPFTQTIITSPSHYLCFKFLLFDNFSLASAWYQFSINSKTESTFLFSYIQKIYDPIFIFLIILILHISIINFVILSLESLIGMTRTAQTREEAGHQNYDSDSQKTNHTSTDSDELGSLLRLAVDVYTLLQAGHIVLAVVLALRHRISFGCIIIYFQAVVDLVGT